MSPSWQDLVVAVLFGIAAAHLIIALRKSISSGSHGSGCGSCPAIKIKAYAARSQIQQSS